MYATLCLVEISLDSRICPQDGELLHNLVQDDCCSPTWITAKEGPAPATVDCL